MTLNEFLTDWHSPSPTLLVHTSGSTGKPKPMWVEKSKMLNSARITCDFLGLQPGYTALLCMPLDYIAGKMVVVRALERRLSLYAVKPSGHPLRNGQTFSTLSDTDNSDKANGSCSQQSSKETETSLPDHFDFVAMVPMQVYNSLRVPQEAERLRRCRHLIIGGGAIDDDLQRQLATFPNAVWSTYGMTETLSHIALRRLNGHEASTWYTPFPSVKISLDDNQCLCIDAPLVHDGVLKTHDRAEIDSKGRFRILGRTDNVIDSGGIKIQMEEVEKCLRQHLRSPFVITKTKDDKFGEAVVLLTEGTDTEALGRVCAEVLPKFWIPKHILHIDKLPVTDTGKPARAEAEHLVALLLADGRNETTEKTNI